jgi:transposase-like protein/IS1 family transposase
MDPTQAFCPNLDCPARGQRGTGNIGIHSRKERRFRCRQCGKTFTATTGTAWYRLRTAAEVVRTVVTLLAHGCPLQAIVAAYDVDERTVANWLARAGAQSQAVHEHLVEQPRDLGQVQADELRVKRQGGIVWLAMAVMVSTRLWLGGVVSERRDLSLIRALLGRVRRGARVRTLLFCTDGLCSYVRAIRETFREPLHSGKPGRPRWQAWKNLLIAQVIKRYAKRRVAAVTRHIVQGTRRQVAAVLRRSQGAGVINTAYIERLNATFRERWAPLVRRGRALARRTLTLEHGLYLIGTVYNFCTPHASLRSAALGAGRLACTPAMAAGITDHCWTIQELLWFQVPPPRWTPPKRRGRRSRALQQTIEQWCS